MRIIQKIFETLGSVLLALVIFISTIITGIIMIPFFIIYLLVDFIWCLVESI